MTSSRKLVLISGTARSGSTATDLSIGSSPAAFSCGEIRAWFRPWRGYHLEPRCNCGDPDCQVWESFDMSDPKLFHASVLRARDVDVVVDSSKSMSWILDSARWARRAGIDPVLVLTWKDPRDLAFSFYKRDPQPSSIGGAMSAFTFTYGTALSLPLPMIAVRNLRLREQPEAAVGSLCEALGVPTRPDQHRFWESEHHHLFGSDSAGHQVRAGSTLAETPSSADFDQVWRHGGFADDPRLADIRRRLLAIDEERIDAPAEPSDVGFRHRMRLGYVYSKQRATDFGRGWFVKGRKRWG